MGLTFEEFCQFKSQIEMPEGFESGATNFIFEDAIEFIRERGYDETMIEFYPKNIFTEELVELYLFFKDKMTVIQFHSNGKRNYSFSTTTRYYKDVNEISSERHQEFSRLRMFLSFNDGKEYKFDNIDDTNVHYAKNTRKKLENIYNLLDY
ncbi:hypothetical protein [Lentibacillus salicampi]|uniref:DUF3908 domain-containing protein n=1 Tax=Lentibacillus salicampi TaxID=175306 RepID=A0A4Y9AE94_9BACI|nr:hypothetical protein [Lentibacillus salicampi]TFJ93652.1 hypothetical protein E4U82_06760 [Lentibacillus salicampi]